MPVKLKSQSSPEDAMSISFDDYKQGRLNFIDHYYRTGCDPEFGGQDLEVPWSQLADAVDRYKAQHPGDDVALRIVYCYDPELGDLKLRMELCAMEELEDIPGTYALVDANAAWYKIKSGKLVPCQDTNLRSANYFGNFYYCAEPPCDGTNAQLLADGADDQLYARTITFPWTIEIEKMYTDNGSPEDVTICFGATSYVHANSGASNIAFPHGLVLYLRNAEGVPMLNNDKDTVCVFHNKGADFGTLCPTYCDVYVLPASSS